MERRDEAQIKDSRPRSNRAMKRSLLAKLPALKLAMGVGKETIGDPFSYMLYKLDPEQAHRLSAFP